MDFVKIHPFVQLVSFLFIFVRASGMMQDLDRSILCFILLIRGIAASTDTSTTVDESTSSENETLSISWPVGSWQSQVYTGSVVYDDLSWRKHIEEERREGDETLEPSPVDGDPFPNPEDTVVCPGAYKGSPPGTPPEVPPEVDNIKVWRVDDFVLELNPLGKILRVDFSFAQHAGEPTDTRCRLDRSFMRGTLYQCAVVEHFFTFDPYPRSMLIIQRKKVKG